MSNVIAYICPSCGEAVRDESFLALSRIDNETLVCSPCGTIEALMDNNKRLGYPLTQEQILEQAYEIQEISRAFRTKGFL